MLQTVDYMYAIDFVTSFRFELIKLIFLALKQSGKEQGFGQVHCKYFSARDCLKSL